MKTKELNLELNISPEYMKFINAKLRWFILKNFTEEQEDELRMMEDYYDSVDKLIALAEAMEEGEIGIVINNERIIQNHIETRKRQLSIEDEES